MTPQGVTVTNEPRTAEGRAVVEATASDPFVPEDQKPALRAAALRTVLAIEEASRALDVDVLAQALDKWARDAYQGPEYTNEVAQRVAAEYARLLDARSVPSAVAADT